jgi:hypothetical protein
MIRGALSIIAGIFGLVFVLIAALWWLRGTDIRWESRVAEASPTAAAYLRESLETYVDQGRLVIRVSQWIFQADPGAREFYGADHSGWRIGFGYRLPGPRWVGSFWYDHGFRYDAVAYPAMKGANVTLPVWVVLLATGVMPGCLLLSSALSRWGARRRRGIRCTCGYDLRASPERCPECGAAVRIQNVERWPSLWKRRIRPLIWNLTCAASFMAGAVLVLVVLGRLQPRPFRFMLSGVHWDARVQDGRLCVSNLPQCEDEHRQEVEGLKRKVEILDREAAEFEQARRRLVAANQACYREYLTSRFFGTVEEEETLGQRLDALASEYRRLKNKWEENRYEAQGERGQISQTPSYYPLESRSGSLLFPAGLLLLLPAARLARPRRSSRSACPPINSRATPAASTARCSGGPAR